MWGPFRPGPPANPRPPIEIGVFAVDLSLQVDYAIVSHGLGPQRAGIHDAVFEASTGQGSAGKIQSDFPRTEAKASPNTTASGSRVRTAELESLRLIRERSGPSASARAASDPLCRLPVTDRISQSGLLPVGRQPRSYRVVARKGRHPIQDAGLCGTADRSEERRVGKE